MDLVLLQLLVVWVPELRDDPLDVESVHSMRGNGFPVHLGGKREQGSSYTAGTGFSSIQTCKRETRT